MEPRFLADKQHSLQNWAERAFSALCAGIVVFDTEGRLKFANDGAGKILHRNSTELVGLYIDQLLAPVKQLIKALDVRHELEVNAVDGERLHIGCTVSAFPTDEHHATAYVCIFQDISTTRLLRQERDRLLKLAGVSAALPSLLHELRNPLSAINTMVEVILEDLPRGKLHDDLQAVLSEGRRMGLTLQGIGAVGRQLRGPPSAIDQAIREALRVMEPSVQRAGLDLEVDIPNLPTLPFDPAVIRAILFNLITNAIAACSPHDKIRVYAVMREDHFTLCVTDTGPGMSQEVRQRCTELFFSTKQRGSGIGLALCQRAAKAAGGTLQVESGPRSGTCITLIVPLLCSSVSDDATQ